MRILKRIRQEKFFYKIVRIMMNYYDELQYDFGKAVDKEKSEQKT